MDAYYTISIDGNTVYDDNMIAVFDYYNVCCQVETFINRHKLKIVCKKKYSNHCFGYECVDKNGIQISIEIRKCSKSPSYDDWKWDKN